ncbi:hypothetical protein ACFQ1S_42780 [Kibdelosporangium lantanae]|uniref:Uncharacterized protein n=1 Tax=Kibdelosporangium lantanae TaxID=1497396 RepID=A0ABW3MMG5_9PSEU
MSTPELVNTSTLREHRDMARTPWSWWRMTALLTAPTFGAAAVTLAVLLMTSPVSSVPWASRSS